MRAHPFLLRWLWPLFAALFLALACGGGEKDEDPAKGAASILDSARPKAITGMITGDILNEVRLDLEDPRFNFSFSTFSANTGNFEYFSENVNSGEFTLTPFHSLLLFTPESVSFVYDGVSPQTFNFEGVFRYPVDVSISEVTASQGPPVDGTSLSDGTAIFVAYPDANKVGSIRTDSDTLSYPYPVETPTSVVMTPKDEHLFVGSNKRRQLRIFSPLNKGLLHNFDTAPLPGNVADLAVTPDGRYILASHQEEGLISLVDASTGAIVNASNPITLSNPTWIAPGPESNFAYVSSCDPKKDRGSIFRIKLDSSVFGIEKVELELDYAPGDLVVTPDNTRIFVGSRAGKNVYCYDITRFFDLLAVIETRSGVAGLSLTPNARLLYVANKTGNSIAVVSVSGLKVLRDISTNLGAGPTRVVFALKEAPDLTKGYSLGETSNSYSIIR